MALTSVLLGPTRVVGRHSIQPSFIVPTQKVRVLSRGGAPGRNRTCYLLLRRQALYPVSYRRRRSSVEEPAKVPPSGRAQPPS